MSSVRIPWAAGAEYIRLTCRLGEPRPDSASDEDAHPDLMTQSGTVRLTCNAKRIRYTETDGKTRMLTVDSWTFAIRESDGELFQPGDPAVGVEILSGASAGCDPSGFTWTATITPQRGNGWTASIPNNVVGAFDLSDGADTTPLAPAMNTITGRVVALEINKNASIDAKISAEESAQAAWLAQLAAEAANTLVQDAKVVMLQTADDFSTSMIEAQAVVDAIPEWWSGTQTEYNALGSTDPTRLYLITGA